MKQKILAEIEELRKENEGKREACYNNPTAPYTDIKYYSGFFSAFDQIEELVNSLPEEPVRKDICNQCEAHNDKDKCDELVFGHNCPIVTTSEDLEEASGEYTSKVLERTNVLIGNQPVGEEIEAAFRAGAKWQKEQNQSTIELAEDHAYFAGRTKTMDETKEALLSEVLPCFMHGGEADEVVAKLDEVLNQKK